MLDFLATFGPLDSGLCGVYMLTGVNWRYVDLSYYNNTDQNSTDCRPGLVVPREQILSTVCPLNYSDLRGPQVSCVPTTSPQGCKAVHGGGQRVNCPGENFLSEKRCSIWLPENNICLT